MSDRAPDISKPTEGLSPEQRAQARKGLTTLVSEVNEVLGSGREGRIELAFGSDPTVERVIMRFFMNAAHQIKMPSRQLPIRPDALTCGK